MELLAGLILTGLFLFNKNNTNIKNNVKISSIQKTNNDIYNSRNYNNNLVKLNNVADIKYKQSVNFQKTNIIPNYYNKLINEIENNKVVKSNDDITYETTSDILYNRRKNNFDIAYNQIGGHRNTMDNNSDNTYSNSEDEQSKDSTVSKKHDELYNRSVKFNKQNYEEQFKLMEFDNDSIQPKPINNDNSSFLPYEQDNTMTYNVIEPDKLTHNNMLPNFKSHGSGYGSNDTIETQINQYKNRKIELFSGSAKNLDYRPKQERKPLFNPMANLTHLYGMPNSTAYQSSYYIPSRYRNNEKPFQETKVTPGLGLGYNEVNKGGIGETYRTFRPNVDELRVLSKPKTSYGNFPNIANNQNPVNRPIMPLPKKRRPTTFVEMDAPVNKYGEIKAPTVQGTYNIPITSRSQTTKEWKGPANFYTSLPKPQYMQEKVRSSSKENFNTERAGHVGKTTKQIIYDKNDIAKITQRTVNNKSDRCGTAIGTSQINKSTVPNNDIPNITLRDIHNNFQRAGSIGIQQANKSYSFDTNNAIPQPTLRDLTSINTNINNIGTSQLNKSFVNNNDTPNTTLRDIHNNYDRSGQLGTTQLNKSFINNNDAPNTTLRDIHNTYNRSGQLGTAQLNKSFLNNNDAPNTTLRDIHNTYDRSGQLGTTQLNKSFLNNNDAPNTTLRDIHNTYNRSGQLGTTQLNKSFLNNNDAPNTTLRDIHNTYDRSGQLGTTQLNKSFLNNNDAPNTTLRDIHNTYDRSGQLGTTQLNKAFVNNNDAPNITLRNIHENNDRAGQCIGTSQSNKTHAFDYFTNIPDPTMKDIHIHSDRPGQGMGAMHLNKQQAFDYFTNRPDPTFRDIFADTKYVSPPCQVNKFKQMSRHDYYSALINNVKEVINKGRDPTPCNYNKIPTFDHTIVQLCNPLQINRESYPDIIQDVRTRPPVNITKHSNNLPQQPWHFYSHIDKNIKNNPFVNNIIHQSGLNV